MLKPYVAPLGIAALLEALNECIEIRLFLFGLPACQRTPIVGIRPAVCEFAAMGHATAAPPRTPRKSRRRIASPKLWIGNV
jgi:hypothetical protein